MQRNDWIPDFNIDPTPPSIIFSERHKISLFLELGRCQIDLALCGRWRYRRSWVIISTNHVGVMPVDGMEQLTYFVTTDGVGSLLKSGILIVTRDCTLHPKYGLLPPDYTHFWATSFLSHNKWIQYLRILDVNRQAVARTSLIYM